MGDLGGVAACDTPGGGASVQQGGLCETWAVIVSGTGCYGGVCVCVCVRHRLSGRDVCVSGTSCLLTGVSGVSVCECTCVSGGGGCVREHWGGEGVGVLFVSGGVCVCVGCECACWGV